MRSHHEDRQDARAELEGQCFLEEHGGTWRLPHSGEVARIEGQRGAWVVVYEGATVPVSHRKPRPTTKGVGKARAPRSRSAA